MKTTARLAMPLVALALAASACGGLGRGDGGGGGGGRGGTEHPTAADRLILRMDTGGGFVPAEFLVEDLPEFSLLGDGTIVVEGPQIEIYPGPALPNLQARTVSEEGIQAILARAREAGLFGPDAHYDYPFVADAPTTTFTLVAEGETHVISAYALGFDLPEGEEGKMEGPNAEERAALARFASDLTDLARWLPDGALGPEHELAFDEIRIYAIQADPADSPDTGVEPSLSPWPLDVPLGEIGEPVEWPITGRCGAFSGEELDALLPALRESNELTYWTSDGETYRLLLRPLLPDESGCPDLG